MRSASSVLRTPAGVIVSAISGDGGASRTRTPDEWLMTNVSIDSSSPASSSGTRSAIDLFFGLRLSRTPTSPNWNEPSTRTVLLPRSAAADDGEVDGDRRPADAALRAEHGDELAGFPVALRRDRGRSRDRGDRDPVLLLALPRVDLADRGAQLVAAERLDEELAGAGEHRPTEVVRLALDRHHHDRCGRDLGREQLGRRDPVHVGHVDVHQHDIRAQAPGHLERLPTGVGGPDHLDVALEPEELREVVARLGDVVDDEDLDRICHVWRSAFAARPSIR